MNLRRAAKRLVFLLAAVLTAPLWLLSWLEKKAGSSEALFSLCTHLLAVAPGPPGVWMRAAFYWAALDACAWETHIGFGTLFTHRGASVGTRVSTGSYCVIGHAVIGPDTRLASRVSIPSGKRQHLDEAGALSSATRFETVTVAERCWIGEAAVLLADVGPGSIIGAGAIVTRAMPGASLISGNPASVVRSLPDAERGQR